MQPSLPELILPIKLEKSEESLTSLGGLVVLEEMAQALGLWKRLDARLKGPGSGRGYRPSEFVQPLVWMLHAGGRRQGEEGVAGLESVNWELTQKALEPEGEELILDVDATEIEAEKQEAKWTYNHVQGYMPLVGYVASAWGTNSGKAT